MSTSQRLHSGGFSAVPALKEGLVSIDGRLYDGEIEDAQLLMHKHRSREFCWFFVGCR